MHCDWHRKCTCEATRNWRVARVAEEKVVGSLISDKQCTADTKCCLLCSPRYQSRNELKYAGIWIMTLHRHTQLRWVPRWTTVWSRKPGQSRKNTKQLKEINESYRPLEKVCHCHCAVFGSSGQESAFFKRVQNGLLTQPSSLTSRSALNSESEIFLVEQIRIFTLNTKINFETCYVRMVNV